MTLQNNDLTDVDGVEEHLRRTNPAYKRRPQAQFRKVVERAVLLVQKEGGPPKPELQLQVLTEGFSACSLCFPYQQKLITYCITTAIIRAVAKQKWFSQVYEEQHIARKGTGGSKEAKGGASADENLPGDDSYSEAELYEVAISSWAHYERHYASEIL